MQDNILFSFGIIDDKFSYKNSIVRYKSPSFDKIGEGLWYSSVISLIIKTMSSTIVAYSFRNAYE